jgi:hypothetical protein
MADATSHNIFFLPSGITMLYNGDNERWRMVMPRPSLISQGKQRKYEVSTLV